MSESKLIRRIAKAVAAQTVSSTAARAAPFVSYRRAGARQLIDEEATLQRFYRPGLMGLLLKGQS
jgi:hypothetical protein